MSSKLKLGKEKFNNADAAKAFNDAFSPYFQSVSIKPLRITSTKSPIKKVVNG
ncbi:hypothetical protein [Desulfuribacillus stibiiarsenatis]|uniref:hypothetical protein n=1 Tax=Desulfuribacillus stibiiarsenatis TaxID=1390249 RepID=UPI00159F2D8B|nr:hypothetical protein [Desulfuribacillus stibiiarsenatis]